MYVSEPSTVLKRCIFNIWALDCLPLSLGWMNASSCVHIKWQSERRWVRFHCSGATAWYRWRFSLISWGECEANVRKIYTDIAVDHKILFVQLDAGHIVAAVIVLAPAGAGGVVIVLGVGRRGRRGDRCASDRQTVHRAWVVQQEAGYIRVLVSIWLNVES